MVSFSGNVYDIFRGPFQALTLLILIKGVKPSKLILFSKLVMFLD